jgi:PAS domain S-box-containing protein
MDNHTNILIVDDQPRNLDALEAILDSPDYTIVRAESAEQALLAILRTDFAAIVLDIQMPGVSGIELAQLIKRRKRTQHVPLLFLTAHSVDESEILKGYGAGAVDYLSKPVNSEILRTKVAVFVDLYRKNRALVEANRALQAEVAERLRVQAELRLANEQLESRVQDRTRDLTLANDALREGEERLRLAVAAARLQPWEMDLVAGRITFGTDTPGAFGFAVGSWDGPLEDAARVVHPGDRRGVLEQFRAAVDSGGAEYRAEFRIVRADGAVAWVLNRGRIYRDAAGRAARAVGVLMDITERKQAELATARLAAIVESSDDAIISKALDGTILSWNRGAQKMLGISAQEALGRNITFVVPPERHEEERAVLAKLRRGEAIEHFETVRLTADGRRIDISMSISPLVDSAGRIVGASTVARDITDRKRSEAALAAHAVELERRVQERTTELLSAHERLRQSERLATVGTLAAGLGHDMSNLLLPIRARLGALADLGLPAGAADDIAAIGEAAGYLQRLASGLRLLAADPDRVLESQSGTDLAQWWRDVEGVLRAGLPRGVRLEGRIEPGLPPAAIPASRLTQAVFNLVQNAGEAVATGATVESGHVRVATAGVREESDGAFVQLVIADNGAGMTPEVAARCFEPYFSTKVRAVSTGMGLPLVRAWVEAAGGRVELRTAPGQGATFALWLPAAARLYADSARSSPAMVRAAVSLDDARLASMTKTMLSSAGASVFDWHADGIPGADLWVLAGAAASADRIIAFLSEGPDRRAVVLEDDQHDHADPALARPDGDWQLAQPGLVAERLVYLGRRPTFAVLRDALSAATQRARAGGVVSVG